MKRAKRVRFEDRVPDRSQSGRFESASAPSNSTEAPPASNNPKTSEFAFFKKFREDASLKHKSKSPPRENIQLKCSKEANHGGGVTDNKKVSNSSFFTESARPSKSDLLVSPQFVSSSLIKTNRRKNQEEDVALSSLIKTPTSNRPGDFFLERATDSVRSDTRYMDGDIFSKKRAKLQSLVAKTMNPRNGEVLMGCDLISLLLNRLIPESSESKHSEAFKSTPDKEETEYQSLYLPESSCLFKESWNKSARKSVKHEKPYFNGATTSSCLSNKTHQKFLLEEPVQSACPPALECAEHMVLGHQYKEIEDRPYFRSKTNRPRTLKGPFESIPEERASPIQSSLIDIEWPYFRSLTTWNEQVSSLPRPYVGPKSNNCVYPSNKEPNLTTSWEIDLPTTATTSIEEDDLAEEAFLEANGKSYGNFGTFNPRRMTPEYDSVQEHSLNDYKLHSSPCMNNYGNKFLLEYEKKEPECIADMYSGSRSSALTTFIESDELDDDLGHLRFRRKSSDLVLGWDIDKLKEEEEIIYSFPADTRSDLPLTVSYELIPAVNDDNGFAFSPRQQQQCLFPQRSYCNAIEAPVAANPSPCLLLEGGEDDKCGHAGIGEIDNTYSTISMSRFSTDELLWPSQIQRLDWRDNGEEMYLL